MEICDANRLNMLSFYGSELPPGLSDAAFRRTPLSQVASCAPANCNYYTSDYRGTIFNPFDRGYFQTAGQNSASYGYCPIDISSAALTMERASRLAIQSYQQQQQQQAPDYHYHHQHSQLQQQQQQLSARSTGSQIPLSLALFTNDAEKLFSKTAANGNLQLRPIMSDPTSPEVHWDINDQTLPKVQDFDTFELWPDGHCRMAYAKTSSDSVRRHTSGWAMRNTNNHNSQILKKSCLGVLLCTTPACGIALRPAICDKARRSQEGRPCSRANCGGTVYLRGCRGHGGYPVTHFWREVGGTVFFQAKGHHDHARPDLKPVRRSKTLVRGRKRALARTGPPSASPVTQVTSPAANLEFRFKQCPPLTVDRGTAEAFSGYRTSVPLPIPRSCLQEACGTQNLLNHNNLAAFGIDLRGMQQVHSELPCGGLARATDSQKAITSRSLNLTNPDFASHQRPSLVSSTRSYTSTYPNHFNQPPLQDVEAAPACVPPNHRSDSPFVAAGVPPNSRLATAVDLAPLKREHEQTEMADEDSLLQGEDKSPICSHAPVGCEGLAEKRNWLATPSCFPGCYQQGESISTNSGEKNASWSTPSPPTGGSSMLFNVTEMPGGVGPIDEPAVRKLDPDAHRGPDYDVSWMTATGMGISECQWPIRVGSRMNHMSMQSSTPMSADFSHGGLQTRRCESTFAPAGIPFCLESSGSRTSQGSSSNSGSGQLLQQ